jgi:hypothetical protein
MFEPEVHEYRTSFAGDADAALDLARTALVSQGFEITSNGSSEMRLSGPGMRSNRRSALLGATDVWLRITGSEIAVTATLGGVARMKAFVTLFPPGLILSLFVPAWITGTQTLEWPWVAMMIVPWLFISPLMAASMKRSTEKAIDGMVRGMAQVGSHR